jgi:hypothetical protein
MQIHTPGGNVADGEFPVSFRHASHPFAVITLDQQTRTRLFMETRSDCERLIRAAGKALATLPGETGGSSFTLGVCRKTAREALDELREAEEDGLDSDDDDRIERDPYYWVGRLTSALEHLLEASETTTAPGHPFASPGLVAPDRPAPDECMTCGQPRAAHPTAGDDAGRAIAADLDGQLRWASDVAAGTDAG